VLQCVAACGSVLQCVAVCCSVLQCVAVCCSVLQCVAVCVTVIRRGQVHLEFVGGPAPVSAIYLLQCVAVRYSAL